MTWLRRWSLLPEVCRTAMWQATVWAACAAVMDAVCGLLLVPVLMTWWRAGTFASPWLFLLLAATALHALVFFVAQRRGYLAGGGLMAGLLGQLLVHMPRLNPLGLRRIALPQTLLRGPVLHSMAIPAHLIAPMVSAVVTPSCVILGLWLIDTRMASVLTVAGAALAVLLRWASSRSARLERERSTAEEAMSRQLQSFARHQILIRASGPDVLSRSPLEEALHSLRNRSRELLLRGLPSDVAFAFGVQASFAFAILLGGWSVVHSTHDGALVVAAILLLGRFIEPLAQLTHLDQALRGALQSLDVLLRILGMPPLKSPAHGERVRDSSIHARELDYRLDEERVLLQDINLHVPPGSLTVLVGPSGAGKSTLLMLLARIFDPSDGCVLMGQADARRLDEVTLARSRSVMFQGQGVLRGSIAWNLRLADARADFAQMRDAARAAALWDDIELLPGGWDADVGPDGALLSGGQRQRLCMARCLMSPAAVLMLDEPTANLDALSQSRVVQTLISLRGQRTVLAVTHLPALARAADQVLVLIDGRLTDGGTHEQLLSRCSWYAAFATSGAVHAPGT